MYEHKALFDFILSRVKDEAEKWGLPQHQAFPRWFTGMCYVNADGFRMTDGSRDGKIDMVFHYDEGRTRKYGIINSKFTKSYDRTAPTDFYSEVVRFWKAFDDKKTRTVYLDTVDPAFRSAYRELFARYDQDEVELVFLTNFRENDRQAKTVKSCNVKLFHQEELVQYVIDHIEGAMPRTRDLLLTGISTVLSPDTRDSEVPTSIVFARLADFIEYMKDDAYDLLFARNVRLWLKNTIVNREIEKTFKNAPTEFAYSNNGITLLCEDQKYDPARKELRVVNPRVVNGSQTLHSVRNVEKPSQYARVMLRIIQVEGDTEKTTRKGRLRQEIINSISVRSNMQNPIKKWDLCANDSFQMELSRFFRSKGLFYERRKNEWNLRRSDLRGVGIRKGPNIKELAQYVASFYYETRSLGPAAAKQSVSELFDDRPYSIIRSSAPLIVYQIYLLSAIIEKYVKQLKGDFRYVRNLKGHVQFALFAVIVKAMKSRNASWGKDDFTAMLEEHAKDRSGPESKAWLRLLKAAINFIRRAYEIEDRKHRKREGTPLTYNNYFKAALQMGKVMSARLPRTVSKEATAVLRLT